MLLHDPNEPDETVCNHGGGKVLYMHTHQPHLHVHKTLSNNMLYKKCIIIRRKKKSRKITNSASIQAQNNFKNILLEQI
jgi:hypothetical protein